MVQGPDNKTYLVRQNDKLLDGTVKAITAQGLVILQEVNDPLSLVKQKEVRKMLRGNRGREVGPMRRYGIVLVTLTALAAIVAPATATLAAATGARLTAITATDGARPAVLIEASEPVAYSPTRPDPFTVARRPAERRRRRLRQRLHRRPGSPVRGVAVETGARRRRHARSRASRVSLAEPVSHRVRSQRNLIFVELDRDAALSA